MRRSKTRRCGLRGRSRRIGWRSRGVRDARGGGNNPALWRVEAYPRQSLFKAPSRKSGWRLPQRCRRAASRHCRGAPAGARLARREPPRLSAAARRAFLRLRLALARRNTARRDSRLRSTRRPRSAPASIPRPAAASCLRPAGAAPPLSPAARYRDRQRHPGDCRSEARCIARYSLAISIRRRCVSPRHHARRNGVAGRCALPAPAGLSQPALRRREYDLILANILARPLALMARDLKRALAPGGPPCWRGCCAGRSRSCWRRTAAQHLCSIAAWSSRDGRP